MYLECVFEALGAASTGDGSAVQEAGALRPVLCERAPGGEVEGGKEKSGEEACLETESGNYAFGYASREPRESVFDGVVSAEDVTGGFEMIVSGISFLLKIMLNNFESWFRGEWRLRSGGLTLG